MEQPIDTIISNPKALVYGSGLSGLSIALRLAREDIPVDIVQTSDEKTMSPGYLNDLLHDPALLERLREEAEQDDRITFLASAGFHQVVAVDQGFLVATGSNGDRQTLEYGAIVFAPERVEAAATLTGSLNLTQLYSKLIAEETMRGSIVFLLDYQENITAEVFRDVLHAALRLRKTPNNEVWVLSQQVQVALQGQEELYDRCREDGVIFVKYGDDLQVEKEDDGFRVQGVDTQVGVTFTIAHPNTLIIPQKATLSSFDAAFAQSLNIHIFREKYTQPDSLWRLPNETNRPGIFAVGSARDNLDLQAIYNDVASGVLSVRKRLSPDGIPIKEHIPVVEDEKCAYCLTCVRICPFGAMAKDVKERIARVIASACQACGICVGECPAEALQMRNLENESLYSGIKCLSV